MGGFPHSHQLFSRNCLPPRMGLCYLWNWLATPHLRNESTKIQNRKTGLTGHMGAILSGSLVMTLATPLSQGSSLWVRVEADARPHSLTGVCSFSYYSLAMPSSTG